MANPVQNQQQAPAAIHQPVNNLPANAAPQGIGAAPDTLQTAVQEPAPQRELGYIERAVQWLVDWLVSTFKRVFYCCFPPPPPPPPPPEEPIDNRPIPPEVRPPVLVEAIRTEVDLLEAIDRLTERERNRIYRQIGILSYRKSHIGSWLSSYEEIGRGEVQKNPLLLLNYIMLIEEEAVQEEV